MGLEGGKLGAQMRNLGVGYREVFLKRRNLGV
jgi:hypothetical protein